MTDQEILNIYRRLVPFLADLCGNSCEILLQDVSHPGSSVIAVQNGYHSGRGIGSPVTAFAASLIESGEYRDKDYITGSRIAGKGPNDISSTWFIKNEGRLIGLLCINRDMSTFNELNNVIRRLKSQYNLLDTEEPADPDNTSSPAGRMKDMIADTITESGLHPERMTRSEKIGILRELQAQGVLNMKGCVNEIAAQLEISVPTVYRYLKEL